MTEYRIELAAYWLNLAVPQIEAIDPNAIIDTEHERIWTVATPAQVTQITRGLRPAQTHEDTPAACVLF